MSLSLAWENRAAASASAQLGCARGAWRDRIQRLSRATGLGSRRQNSLVPTPQPVHIPCAESPRINRKAGNSHIPHSAAPGLWFSCWNYIIVQNLDWPVSRETPSLFLSRTRMASFPYCEYHALRLLLRYVPGGADSSFSCCRCQMNREVSLYRCRAWPSDSAFSARGTRPLIPGPASPPGPAHEAPPPSQSCVGSC